MPEAEVNGTRLYYELHGGGASLALVHGSMADATGARETSEGAGHMPHVTARTPTCRS